MANPLPLAIFSLFIFSLSSGCSTFWGTSRSYDASSITIESIPLFNQRSVSSFTRNSWKGDWLMRRDRLELVDRELRTAKPDIVILQEMITKKGSPSESDINILSSGALKGYEWDVVKVNEYIETEEEQYHAVAASLPVVINKTQQLADAFWAIGPDGYLTLSLLQIENQVIPLFVVEMPSLDGPAIDPYYKNVLQHIRDALYQNSLCAERIIIAGFMPGDLLSPMVSEFMRALSLKDVADGFCRVATDCFTATGINEIYQAIASDQSPAKVDRILVHELTLVSSSHVILNKPEENNRYEKSYSLSRLWPTARFGWQTNLRLPSNETCEI